MGIAFVWFFGAIIVGVFAANRGRSGLGWFVLALLISPLLGLLLVAVSKNLSGSGTTVTPGAATHRKCPACAEWILPEANVCKHCGKDVEPDDAFYQRKFHHQALQAKANNQVAGIMVLVVLLGVFVAAMMAC